MKKLTKSKTGKILIVVAGMLFLYFTLLPALKKARKENEIKRIIEKIKANKEWYASVVAKAEGAPDRTLDDQLRLDAIWILEHGDDYSGFVWYL